MPVRKMYGCKPDKRDDRDHMFAVRALNLPPAVDLRQWCAPVMDQGDLGACTAHGITGGLRYAIIKAGQPDVHLSRLQLYYDERKLEGTVDDDAGAEIRDGIKCTASFGVGHETMWPYNIHKFKDKPPGVVYADAVHFKALKYERVPVGVTALKSALFAGHPVVIGVTLYDSFESDEVAKTGMVPMPGKDEGVAGGHCMLCVGYGQKPNTFTVRNSWATDWGDKGDCYMPEAYLGSSRLGSDYWVITAAL